MGGIIKRRLKLADVPVHGNLQQIQGDGEQHINTNQLGYLRDALYQAPKLRINPDNRVGNTYYRSGETVNYYHQVVPTIENIGNVKDNRLYVNAQPYDADEKTGEVFVLQDQHVFAGSQIHIIGDFEIYDKASSQRDREYVYLESRLEILALTSISGTMSLSILSQAFNDGDVIWYWAKSNANGEYTFNYPTGIQTGQRFYSYLLVDEDLSQQGMNDIRDKGGLSFENSFAMVDQGVLSWNNGHQPRSMRVFRSNNNSSTTATAVVGHKA